MSLEEAEKYKREQDLKAQRMFKPTEEGWTEAPLTKFRETLGGSVPYIAAPIAGAVAGVGAAALGAPAAVAGVGAATIGALTAGAAQYTGSNLAAQMEDGTRLADTSLLKAGATAIPQAALDTFSLKAFPIINRLFGQAGIKVSDDVAKEVAKKGMLATAGEYALAGSAVAGREGITEVGQEFLQRLQAGQNLTDEEARRNYYENFIGGAVLGGTFGVVGRKFDKTFPQQQEAESLNEPAPAQPRPSEMLMLPAPEEQLMNDRKYDPFQNPLGNFMEGELTPEQIGYINKDRKDNGKPRLSSYSLEDYVDALRHSSDTEQAKQGALDNFLTFKTGYDGTVVPTVDTVIETAKNKNVETGTQGFNDFLMRTTGTDNLEAMSPVQLYSAFDALRKIPESETLQILPEGTNAVRFSDKQYNQAINNLKAEYEFYDTDVMGRTSVINDIMDTTGLKDSWDAKALLRQAINRGDLEERITTRKVDGQDRNVVNIAFAGKTEALPQGFDIRDLQFKQGVEPENYEVKNGSVTLDRVKTLDEAQASSLKYAAINEKLAQPIRNKVDKLNKAIESMNTALDINKSQGYFGTPAHDALSAEMGARIRKAQAQIAFHDKEIQNLSNPLKVVPVGEKPIVNRKQVFYDEGKPVASFKDKDSAEQFGLMRKNKDGEFAVSNEMLQQIIDTAPTTKGTLPKRYASYAKKELERRAGNAPKGIEVRASMYKPKVEENFEKIRQSLLPTLKRFGLERVGLNVVKSIADGQADGSYVRELIKIAYNAENPMATLRHESIHALKNLGAFTDGEWKILTNKAKSDWINQYIKPDVYEAYKADYKERNKSLKGFDDYMAEEAIAEAFANYARTAPPAGAIGNLFKRLSELFKALLNAFKLNGFKTEADIFEKIERGEAKIKAPKPQAKPEEERFSVKDRAEVQKFIDKVYADTPTSPFNSDQHAFVYDNAESGVFFELKPSTSVKGAVEVYWFSSFPQRQGVGMKGMKQLQDLAAKEGLSLTLMPWDKGQVSKAALTRFYKSAGFKPLSKGSQTLVWTPEETEKLQRKPEAIRKIGDNLVGAPPDARTVKDRTALVKRMTNLLEHPYSMYDKSKDWYERSGDSIADIAHGDKELMEKIVRLTALYSQANSLGGNITAVIKSMAQLAKGDITAFAGRFPETTAKVIPEILKAKEFNTNLAGVEDKLMNFYQNLHDGTFKTDTFEDASTIDRWMMRLFGYPHAEDREEGGASSVSATQYKYAKDLVQRIAEANEKRTAKYDKEGNLTQAGEKLLPRQIQAVLWTYIKNTTEFQKAKAEGKEKDFKPNSLDFSDYVNRATANITWESRPSTSVDMLQGIHNAPRKQQDEFNRAVRSIFETEDGENKIFKLLNEGVLYSSQNSIGAYENQIAPNIITKVVLGKDDKGHLTEVADKTAAIIGYVTKQDAVPWYRADPTASGKMASKGYKVTVNQDITQDFEERLFKHLDEVMPGVGFTRVDNSFDFINFRGDDGKPFFMKDAPYIDTLQTALKKFGGDKIEFKITPFRAESAYIYNDWKENPDGKGYLGRFSPRQLTDIQSTIDGWSKDYDSIADQFGKEYGWNKPAEGTTKDGEQFRLRAPKTPEFEEWIGDSVAIDENGEPIVFYHGTDQDIKTFKPSKEGTLGKGIYITPNPEYAGDYTEESQFGEKRGTGANVIPLYARVEFPLIVDFKRGHHPAVQALEKLGVNPDKAVDIVEKANEEKGNITNELMSRAKKIGHDAIFYKNEDGTIREAVVFEPNQLKSVFNQKPSYSADIRFQRKSLNIDPAIQNRINATTHKRVEKGYVERLMDAISPTYIARLRQAFLNKYEGIERLSRAVGEQFGADQLLAENSAIAAALQSDRAAGVAASSFRDGVPIYDKGYTYVSDLDGKVKGLIPILEPLMQYNNAEIFQAFQFYAGTRRGKRLLADGREQLFTKEDIEYGNKLEQQFPEFKDVFNEYQKYNQGLVNYMKDTGVISEKEAKLWTENWDYIPFYRQLDGETTAGPRVFSSIAGVSKPKKLKGGEAELDDFMETIVRNARAAIEAGMKNEAANRVVRDALRMELAEEVALGVTGSDIITVKEKGVTKYYRVADPILVESMKGLNLPQLEFLSWLAAPANLLRNFVTKDPGFMVANLGRDSLQAWITSGTGMTPIVDTFKQFGKTLANQSPEASALARAGLTGYDFSGDIASTAKVVEKELRKRGGARTAQEKALLPLTAFWDMLEKGSHASDMATRAEVYKRTLERTGSEAEAFYQAMEVINFSRKGNNSVVRILSAVVPFFNARVQGLDVLYRSGWGKMATENADVMKKAFASRALTLMGMSMLYWFMVSDDEEYKKLNKEERDNYWIIPAFSINDKPFRFPIPFELGVVFKVIPERVLETAFGNDTGKDLKEALTRNIFNTLQFNPIPQAFIPIVENVANYSFFTGEPVVGRGMEDVAPRFQSTSATPQFIKDLGAATGTSPIKIENLIRGYTGTMGTYATMLLDAIYRGQGDPTKASMRLEQMPVIKRFFASDSGTISAYYDMKGDIDQITRTISVLERTGNNEDLKEYLQEKGKLYGLKNYVNIIDKDMKRLRQMQIAITNSTTMEAEAKREALDAIHERQVAITARIKMLRKQFD
jgi:hypothetical protein